MPSPLSAPTILNMQPQSGIFKRQAKRHDAKDRWRQAKERYVERQRQIRHGGSRAQIRRRGGRQCQSGMKIGGIFIIFPFCLLRSG
jgi:hypothetical protein